MVNDRDEKFEGHEESEYHFSDDDMSYEVENEGEMPKTTTMSEPKESILTRLSRSKRMLISFIVFLVLIFVVYKMVSPTNPIPTTDISAPAPQPIAKTTSRSTTTTTSKPTPAQLSAINANETTTSVIHPAPTAQPSQIVTNPTEQAPLVSRMQPPSVQVMQQPSQAGQQQQPLPTNVPQPSQPMMTQQVVPEQALPQQVVQPMQTSQQQIQPPQQQMQPALQQQVQPLQQVTHPVIQSMQQPAVQPTVTQQTMATPEQPSPYGQPQLQHPMMGSQMTSTDVIPQQQTMVTPEQSIQQPFPLNQGVVQQPPQSVVVTTTTPQDSGLAALGARSNQLIAQLQMQYMQRLNEFSTQNKNLQSQVTSLNARVVNMEGELNQLIQILTHEFRARSAPPPTPAAPPPPRPQVVEQIRSSFNVQAIIPGRAWLKSENGDTVTVAEGDVVKNLGRVTRIDPYDGVVEINTGSRTISLSYGNSS